MGIIDKIEDLVFESKAFAAVEIIKNRTVILKMRCEILTLTKTKCTFATSSGVVYNIIGSGLEVKEYGDTFVVVGAKNITGVTIEGGECDE